MILDQCSSVSNSSSCSQSSPTPRRCLGNRRMSYCEVGFRLSPATHLRILSAFRPRVSALVLVARSSRIRVALRLRASASVLVARSSRIRSALLRIIKFVQNCVDGHAQGQSIATYRRFRSSSHIGSALGALGMDAACFLRYRSSRGSDSCGSTF